MLLGSLLTERALRIPGTLYCILKVLLLQLQLTCFFVCDRAIRALSLLRKAYERSRRH